MGNQPAPNCSARTTSGAAIFTARSIRPSRRPWQCSHWLRLAIGLLLSAGSAQLAHAEWTRYGDSLFQKSTEQRDWFEARASCEAQGALLASAHSEADNQFLANLCFANCRLQGTCDYTSDCWLGLNDLRTEGQFEWVDGSPYDWNPPHFTWNQPDRDCFVLEGTFNNGAWEGDYCSDNPNPATENKYYLCQKDAAFASLTVNEPIGLRAVTSPPEPEQGYQLGTQVEIEVTATHPFFELERWDCVSDNRPCNVVVDTGSLPGITPRTTFSLTIEADTTLDLMLTMRHCTVPDAPQETWMIRDGKIALPSDAAVGLYEVVQPGPLTGHQVIVLFDSGVPGMPEFFDGTEAERDLWVDSIDAGRTTNNRPGPPIAKTSQASIAQPRVPSASHAEW